MFNVGMLVKIDGVSQHGQNRIDEHGSVWKVESISQSSILLKATDGTDYLRWMMVHGEDRDWALVDVLTIPED